MRVLIHTDEYFPTGRACAFRMKALTDALIEGGNDVTVLVSATSKTKEKLNSGERVIYAPTIRMKKKTNVMRLLNNLSFAITSLFVSLRSGKADVVITTSPPLLISISGWLIARMKGARLVFDVRDIWPDVALEMHSFTKESVYFKVFDHIAWFMYKHADMITTVTPGKIEKIRGKLRPQEQKKLQYISNGFDDAILNYSVDETFSSRYHMDEKFTCVFAGNIGVSQGLDVLVDLADCFRQDDIQFLLFGAGAEEAKLAELVQERGIHNVYFCGMLDHSKMYTVLKKAKLSFVPLKSADMKDSIPSKLYEALGLGCPVLLVADGDACELIYETGLGRCVSPDKTEMLPDVFQEMMDNYDDILKNRESAIEIIKENYSRKRINREYEKVLRKMYEGLGGGTI